jgi:hypothetical protein
MPVFGKIARKTPSVAGPGFYKIIKTALFSAVFPGFLIRPILISRCR